MARQSLLELHFPVGGLARKYAYQQQGPYTTPDACNVRPVGTIEGRASGGSRPGLGRAFIDQLGSGEPVRMLAPLTVIKTDGFTNWTDPFDGESLGDAWAAASWIAAQPSTSGAGGAVVEDGETGTVRDALPGLNVSSAYELGLYIQPYLGAHHGTYSIFCRMDDTTPAGTTDGVIAELEMTGDGGVYGGQLRVFASGVETTYSFTPGAAGVAESGWFLVLVDGNNVKVYWAGREILSQDVSAAAGSRIGFGLNCTEDGGRCIADTFRAQYYSTALSRVRRNLLVASAGGDLYREGLLGRFVAVASDADLADDRAIQAVERGQKLYIADHGDERVSGTDGSVAAGGTDLSATGVADWTALGIDINSDVVVVTNGTGDVADGTYLIDSLESGKLVLASSCGGSGTCAYSVQRAPKVYDPAADTLSIWAATADKGQVPTGCEIIARYRDRLVMATSNTWFMSRQGDPLDWDYGADSNDAGRAVAGVNAEAGLVGEIITALVPFSDDYLLFGCEQSLWRLRGDPAYGGQIDNVSQAVGIVGRGAWCLGPAGEVVFLSRDGVYTLAPGAGSYPASLSREKLPQELRDVDPALYTVTMAYDTRDRGVHLYLTPNDANGRMHWWIDWETKSFWPFRLQGDHEPTALSRHAPAAAENSLVLLGSRDGYVRCYRDDNETDEGSEIESWVQYGPMRLAGNGYEEGILEELVATLPSGSGDINWRVMPGESAAEAVTADPRVQGKWSAGRNRISRTRIRSGAVVIQIENAGPRRWAMEALTAMVERAGRQVAP